MNNKIIIFSLQRSLKLSCRVIVIMYSITESARIVDATGPGTMRVRSGTTVSLNCRATGHPEPSVVWTKTNSGR